MASCLLEKQWNNRQCFRGYFQVNMDKTEYVTIKICCMYNKKENSVIVCTHHYGSLWINLVTILTVVFL